MSKNPPVNKDSFCVFPFIHFNIKPQKDSMLTYCWKSFESFGSTQNAKVSELWNSPKAKELRSEFLSGGQPQGCHRCWDNEKEDPKFPSLRKTYLKKYYDRVDSIIENYLNRGEQADLPLTGEIRFSSLCNLRCLHCDSNFSSKWKSLQNKHPELSDLMSTKSKNTPTEIVSKENIDDIISHLLDNLVELRVSGGEPLIEDNFIYFLQNVPREKAKNIELIITTNLNKLWNDPDHTIELLTKFKVVKFRISIDANPEIYFYIRSGGSIEKIEENLRLLRAHPQSHKFEFDALLTLSSLNLSRCTAIFDYFDSLDLGFFVLFVNLYPNYLDARTLPIKIVEEARIRLSAYKESKGSHKTKEQIARIEDFLRTSLYSTETWQQFKKFIIKMDEINKTDFQKTYPELSNYFD